jgi:hypothetical protein
MRNVALGTLGAFRTAATKCMDGSSSSENFSTMQHSTGDEIFLACSHRYPFSTDYQCVASLHNHHVFVVVMGVLCEAAVFLQDQNAI